MKEDKGCSREGEQLNKVMGAYVFPREHRGNRACVRSDKDGKQEWARQRVKADFSGSLLPREELELDSVAAES